MASNHETQDCLEKTFVVVQLLSAKSSLTLCDSMDCTMTGSTVFHCLLEFAQIHVHWVGESSFSFCFQSLPASGSFPMSWLFASGGQSIRGFSFSISPSNGYSCWFPVGLTGLNSLQSKGLTRVFSSTTIWKHQFFGAQPSLWSSSHICTWLLERPEPWLYGPFVSKVMYLLFNTLLSCQGSMIF